MNSLRKLPYSVAFHSKIATFSHFMMNSFFLENPCTFLKQPKVWTFSEMLVFQLISTAKLLPPANFYNFQIFVRKTHFFYFKKAWSSNFLRAVTLSVDSMACLLPLLFLKTSFSRKTEVFFNISKSQKLNVLRDLTNSFALYSNFVTISDFWKLPGFFREKSSFFAKNTAFERFDKSHCSVCIQHQIG